MGGVSNMVDFARNFAVLVKVQGPDPKGLKMRRHAFHLYDSGKTTLSASGVLLPDTLYDTGVAKRFRGVDSGQNLMLVVTVASVVEPFLSLQYRGNVSQDRPELIRGAQIDIMLEGNLDKGASYWVAGQLMQLFDVPASSVALQSILEVSTGSPEHGWEVGWSLASYDSSPQPLMDVIQTQFYGRIRLKPAAVGCQVMIEHENKSFVGESSNPSLLAKSTTRLAVIGISLQSKNLPNVAMPSLNKRGDFLLAVGSPFGILSPFHFFNSVSMGSVANCYPPTSSNRSLLMADIRCLPGVEGGPVFGEDARFVGILIRPLRQKNSGAEIQLVIPWEAIATTCGDLLLKEPRGAEKGLQIDNGNVNALGNRFLFKRIDSDGRFFRNNEDPGSRCPSPLAAEKVMASICLINVDGGVWASGIFLNDQGLILTNAHLLEPWRFGKTTVNGGRKGNESREIFLLPEESASPMLNGVNGCQKSWCLSPKTSKTLNFSLANHHRENNLSSFSTMHRNIRVRLDNQDPWVWSDAKVVFVCKGPLDVALLQLEYIPDQLCPISVTFEHPPVGSMAYVIGHGLFGPLCGFSPSVSSGVVAKIVKAKMPLYSKSDLREDSELPVMLETTAAVHPGGSGGAVLNSDGHMIGLVTSNARHVGGTLIPHLNFSIPSAVLAPIFEFARGMQDFSLLQNLDQPNEHLSSVWALMPPLSPKPDPSLPNIPQLQPKIKNKEGKGSRFAKFMAERDELLKKSVQVGKVERFLDKNFRSKL